MTQNEFDWSEFYTDKHNVKKPGHGYGPLYDKYFSELRNAITSSIIEIGCRTGSAKLWLKYFPNANHIVGADLNPVPPMNSRFEFRELNQLSYSENVKLIQEFPDSKIVIDDGPHTAPAQLTTLQAFLPLMKADSWLVVEDMHCTDPNDPLYSRHIKNSDTTVQNVLREWQQGIYNSYKFLPNPEKIADLDLNIHIEHGYISEIAFIHKI